MSEMNIHIKIDELQREIGRTINEAFEEGKSIGRADAIEEYRKEMHDMIEGDEEFTDWQKYEILECNELVAEQLKGAKECINVKHSN